MNRAIGNLTRDQVVARARSAIGQKTIYGLGKGGRDPHEAHPGKVCDCSGFAAWCVGVDRYLPNDGIPTSPFGAWFETTALAKDAQSPYGFVAQVAWPEALPGDLLVWGDSPTGQGHVGVVASLGIAGPETVVHCSVGNFKRLGDAISETSPGIFKSHGALVARVAWVGGLPA